MLNNFIKYNSFFLKNLTDYCGSIEVSIIIFTVCIRFSILPFKYPLDLNYLNKSIAQKTFTMIDNYITTTQDKFLISTIKKERKQIKKDLKILKVKYIFLFFSIQIMILLLVARVLKDINIHFTLTNIEYNILLISILTLTMIDYFLKQSLSEVNKIDFILPSLLCIFMLCTSFFFSKLFMYYLMTSLLFNIVAFLLIKELKEKKLKAQLKKIVNEYYTLK